MTAQREVEGALGMGIQDIDAQWDIRDEGDFVIVMAWPLGLRDGAACAHCVLSPLDPDIKKVWGRFLNDLASLNEAAVKACSRHWSLNAEHLRKLGGEYGA